MERLRLGELCAGYGGLGMAVEDVFNADTAWFSEFDAAPSKILSHHWPHVPNYGDMTKIDWAEIEPVDIISGGTPCQDLSAAGARRGMTEGTRSNLWVQMREAIAIQRPKYVVWENVRGAYSAKAASDLEHCPRCMGETGHGGPDLRALGRVLGDLSDLGFDAEWRGVRASEVGACHARYRVFILAANRDHPGRSEHGRALTVQAEHAATEYAGLDAVAAYRLGYEHGRGARATVSDATGIGWPQGWTESTGVERGLHAAFSSDPSVADSRRMCGERRGVNVDMVGTPGTREADGGERQRHGDATYGGEPTNSGGEGPDWGAYEPSIRRWEGVVGRPAPRPTEPSGRAGAERLSPRFTEWMMGLPDGWVTDPAIGISRNEQLKACGNGVVPQQAAAALRDMFFSFHAAGVGA